MIPGEKGRSPRYSVGMIRHSVAACAANLLAGCFDHDHAPVRLGRMGKLYGGGEGIDVVEHPEIVEAVRLRAPDSSSAARQFNRWPRIGDPVRVGPEIAARFSRGLTRESTFPRWEDPKACDPRPGFLLRFSGDGRAVDIAFCFECKILFTYRGGESVWYANFDGSTAALAALFLQVFPGDPVLTAHSKEKE